MREGRYEKSIACFQFERELEAHLDGSPQPFVAAHARECSFCRVLLADLQLLRQAARELPVQDPPPAVWANVRARLEYEGVIRTPVAGWRRLFAWRPLPHAVPVGVMGLLMLMGGLVSVPLRHPQTWDVSDAASPASVETTAVNALPTSEETSLARLVANLESDYHAQEASLSPDLQATYEKSLLSLNDSIRECLDSLRQEPRNSLTREYLLTAYTRKAEVLSSALESNGR